MFNNTIDGYMRSYNQIGIQELSSFYHPLSSKNDVFLIAASFLKMSLQHLKK